MNIILGATGRIGSILVEELLKNEQPVRAVVRNELKAQKLKDMGAEVFVANYFESDSLKTAFQGGKTAFLLTPENPKSKDFIEDTKVILKNYREALLSSNITKIVGLSSMGAQYEAGTGNFIASYLLENTFSDMSIEQVFVRPAYYYSNWTGYIDLVRQQGILPTLFPINMKLPMIAPQDVGKFLSKIIMCSDPQEKVYEICGPQIYSSVEIAKTFEEIMNKSVTLQQISPIDWENMFLQAGFSKDGTKNLIYMTQAVIDGKTQSTGIHQVTLSTDFKTYLKNYL